MKVLYIDMDGVIVDFDSGIKKLPPDLLEKYGSHYPENKENLTSEEEEKFKTHYDNCPGIFSLMDPIPDAIENVMELVKYFDVYILSSDPWENETSASDKKAWIKKYFGNLFQNRFILSPCKNLNKGDIIIDDRLKKGVDKFEGKHIHFGQKDFPDWKSVMEYLGMK
jgi:5'-nucleotidase